MMFMMPMPPTSSETAATQASRLRKASVVACCVLMMSCCVCRTKSGLAGSTSWRSTNSALIWLVTLAIASWLSALM